ncbi:MAG: hypothetical protein WCH07_03245 [Deltaproteobacteria bacterium]
MEKQENRQEKPTTSSEECPTSGCRDKISSPYDGFPGRGVCERCSREAKRCQNQACKAWNRLSARYCTKCGESLQAAEPSQWAMEGGGESRNSLVDVPGNIPVEKCSPSPLRTIPLNARNGDQTSKLSIIDGIGPVLVHDLVVIAVKIHDHGFLQAYARGSKYHENGTKWAWSTSPLVSNLSPSNSPVVIDGSLICALADGDDRVVWVWIDAESGIARGITDVIGRLSPHGRPLVYRSKDGYRLAAWPIFEGLAVMVSRNGVTNEQSAFPSDFDFGIVRIEQDHSIGERMHPPVAIKDQIVCLTDNGRLFFMPLGFRGEALEHARLVERNDLRQKGITPAEGWRCGPPAIVAGQIVFLASDKDNFLYWVMWAPETVFVVKIEKIRLDKSVDGWSLPRPLESPFYHQHAFAPYYGCILMFDVYEKQIVQTGMEFEGNVEMSNVRHWVSINGSVFGLADHKIMVTKTIRGNPKPAIVAEWQESETGLTGPAAADGTGLFATTAHHLLVWGA